MTGSVTAARTKGDSALDIGVHVAHYFSVRVGRSIDGPRSRALILGVVMALTMALAVGEGPAGAVTYPCSTSPGISFFDGNYEASNASETYSTGAQAVVTSRTGGFCSPPPTPTRSFYCTWVMTASADLANWAQVGFFAAPSVPLRHYSEYTFFGGYVDHWVPGIATNTAYTYSVFDDSGCTCFKMWEDFTQVDQTLYNPLTSWPLPLSLQFLKETGNLTDQVPGHSTSTTHFENIKTQILGSSWQTFNPTQHRNDDAFLWGQNPTYSCGSGLAYKCADIWGTS